MVTLPNIVSLSGVGYTVRRNEGLFSRPDVNVIVLVIDGVRYGAYEDPDDGYRSYGAFGEIDGDEMIDKNRCFVTTFEPQQMVCVTDKVGSVETLSLYDCTTGKLVVRVGTDYTEDYYPVAIFEYNPQNMAVNLPVVQKTEVCTPVTFGGIRRGDIVQAVRAGFDIAGHAVYKHVKMTVDRIELVKDGVILRMKGEKPNLDGSVNEYVVSINSEAMSSCSTHGSLWLKFGGCVSVENDYYLFSNQEAMEAFFRTAEKSADELASNLREFRNIITKEV